MWDGKFTLQLPAGRSTLEFRYVGYESQHKCHSSPMVTRLREQATTLRELVVRSTNPAVRIIREAVAHREINDPENLPSFSWQ